tara:strand:- start:10945 stop:14334 length:3390 start_codon:yes stop_codon:yes gene_type:complete
MQESYLAACLEIGFKTVKTRRLNAVGRCPEFTLMDKPWKEIVKLAVLETEIPGQDEDGETIAPSPRFRRGRRRGRQQSTIPSPTEIKEMSDESSALRFALLLVNKFLYSEQWSDDEHGPLEKEMRTQCIDQGVHPVWHEMAKRCDLFGQFSACPVLESKGKSSKKQLDLSNIAIDPFDIQSCIEVFSSIPDNHYNPEQLVAMKRLVKRLSSGKWPSVESQLLELEGNLSLVSLLIALNTGAPFTSILESLRKSNKALAERYELASSLTGDDIEWKDSYLSQENDDLGKAVLKLVWLNGPLEKMNPTTEQLEVGLDILTQEQAPTARIDVIRWKMLRCYADEKRGDDALAIVKTISLEHDSDASELLPLLIQLENVEAYDWLDSNIENIDEGGLISIAREEAVPLPLRSRALILLKEQDSEGWTEVESLAVHVFVKVLKLDELSTILLEDDVAIATYPHETLIVAHLLSAHHEESNWKISRKARKKALQTVQSTDVPACISGDEYKLLLLLEGRIEESVNKLTLTDTLPKNGIKAINQIVNALSSGGSHLVDEKHLNNLLESLDERKITGLGESLLRTIASKLRLNNARLSLERGDESAAVIKTLETVLTQPDIPYPIVDGVRELMYEFDLGIEALVHWYQQNHQRSRWALLAQATLEASKGKNLSAARLFKRSADSSSFDYEEEIMLYRKALIHFAFDEKWGEAKQLLSEHPNLKAAITKRFQLYLDVSHQASMQETARATSMLKNYVRRQEVIVEETDEGERTRTKTVFKEDELDLLYTYPDEHPKPLPREPFTGRLLAAITALQRDYRTQSSKSFDRRYRDIMSMRSPEPMEIHTLAQQASESSPLDALRILERAQLSGRFMDRNKSLANLEQVLFRRHQSEIRTSDRRYLRHLPLKPLVLVDTNIVIDALYQRIQEKLNRSNHFDDSARQGSHFAGYLLYLAANHKVDLWLPKVVRGEVENIARSIDDIRSRFENALVDNEVLDSIISTENMKNIVSEVISEFSTWGGNSEEIESETISDEVKTSMDEFLIQHSEIYDELTKMRQHYAGKNIRTQIDGKKIYPQKPDRKIMQYAAVLSGRPIDNVGSIVVATHDGDFTVVARAFEERFGFGIAKNSRTLKQWLRDS